MDKIPAAAQIFLGQNYEISYETFPRLSWHLKFPWPNLQNALDFSLTLKTNKISLTFHCPVATL